MNSIQRVANESVASILRGIWSAELHGVDNIPSTKGAIIAPIHTDLRDGYLLMAHAPRPLMVVKRTDRQNSLHMHALEQLRMSAARAVGSIIVDRTEIAQPQHWFDTLSQSVPSLRHEVFRIGQHLAAGGLVCMFPQGERRPRDTIGPLAPGVARLALMYNVPVIPTDIRYDQADAMTAYIAYDEAINPPIADSGLTHQRATTLTADIYNRLSTFSRAVVG